MLFRNVCTITIFFILIFSSKIHSTIRNSTTQKNVAVIPKPQKLDVLNEYFILTPNTKVVVNSSNAEIHKIAEFLLDKMNISTGSKWSISNVSEPMKNSINLLLDKRNSSMGREGYYLNISKDSVVIRANKLVGLFYGVQTLRQLLPPEVESQKQVFKMKWKIPCVDIKDKPRFRWRGLLLDCGRHFLTKDFVKRYIDLIAYYKMNVLHWHLTEDQGWRIEIKKYPKLTEIGAWRTRPDGSIYGGYYTQEDIKEVVEYGNQRYIMVVPEIEMPGHSTAALASYPEYSCTGESLLVSNQWGVHKDVYCAGNDAVFEFLQNVLTEVMELFPAPYLHIGGDECPKERWSKCLKCQERIKIENLENENELQSYFIKRIEKFIQDNHRRLIGWDEILEGGLAPGATVQSWRGMEGAIAAARSGHDAIMSPNSHVYLNYDIDGTALQHVYAFESVPPELTEVERNYIIGTECCMWTEYAPQNAVDNKLFPRILAVAEITWSPNESKDYEEFYERVQHQYQRLDFLGVEYGYESRPVSIFFMNDSTTQELFVTLKSNLKNIELVYTLDGSEPAEKSNLYRTPVLLEKSTVFKAGAFRNGKHYGAIEERQYIAHKAVNKSIKYKTKYSAEYGARGDINLIDGLRGTDDYRDGLWQGFEQNDLELIIDLGQSQTIESICAGFFQRSRSWIFLPLFVEYAVSDDGKNFKVVARLSDKISLKEPGVLTKDFKQKLSNTQARYVKVFAKNIDVCPDWHVNAGEKARIFADEIIIE